MGFLDNKSRVIDMVLTDYGKELYSKGELRFEYYAFSDDEIDYDPWISNSASLSQTELTASKIEQILNTPIMEARFGRRLDSSPTSRDESNIQDLMFTMPQGQSVLPRMKVSPDVASGSIDTVQQVVEQITIVRNQFGQIVDSGDKKVLGVDKFKSSRLIFDMEIEDYFDNKSMEGYLIRFFNSGSDGLTEITPKRDLQNIVSYQKDVRALFDEMIERSDTISERALATMAGVRVLKK